MLVLVILKGTFSQSNLRALMYVNIISTNVTYLHQYLASEWVPGSSSSYPSAFTTNISHPFHISLKPRFATYFSQHILSNVFDQSFHIAAQFHNRQFCVLWVVSHRNYLYVYRISNIQTTPLLKRSQSGHVKCHHAM